MDLSCYVSSCQFSDSTALDGSVVKDATEINQIQKLWAAVLVRALEDLQGKCGSSVTREQRDLLIKQSYWWFFVSELDGIGSLKWICEALGLDIQAIRARALLAYSARKPPRTRREIL